MAIQFRPSLRRPLPRRWTAACLLLAVGLIPAQPAQAQCLLDQQHTSANAGTGGDVWQSFTAGQTGSLCAVVLWTEGQLGMASLEVRAGEGLDGHLLHSQDLAIWSGIREYAIEGAVGVQAGAVYTLRLIDVTSWRLRIPGGYAGGRASAGPNDDFWFQTLVLPTGQCTPAREYKPDLVFESRSGSLWQAFIADRAGTLCSVGVACQGAMPSTTLSIYQSLGTGGALLHSQTIALVSGPNEIHLDAPVQVSSDSWFTIHLSDANQWLISSSPAFAHGASSEGGGLNFYFTTRVSSPDPCTVDQQQVSAGSSASGDSWQSFTAGSSGNLCSVALRVAGSGSGTLALYDGEGTEGTVLHLQEVALSPGVQDLAIDRPIFLAAGGVYTLRLISAVPWELADEGLYAGGRASVDPASDFWFRTSLEIGSGGPGVNFCLSQEFAVPCPCGNDGPAGTNQGCLNVHGVGGRLDASGVASLTEDTFSLIAKSVPAQAGVFFEGSSVLMGGAGVLFGDGIRCCGGVLRRLEVVQPVGPGATTAQLTVPVTSVDPLGSLLAGTQRCYQYWYRDTSGPCGGGFNMTGAVSVVWVP